MIWELTQDAKGEKSLLKVINDTLRRGSYITGDVNADGSFNVSDLVLLQLPTRSLQTGRQATFAKITDSMHLTSA